ncbi:MAG: TIGR03086 family metal-binding protein [Actinomycetes bacterium]
MDALTALARSSDRLIELAGLVGPNQWDTPTPCPDWPVHTLVGHLIATMDAYRGLLDGAPAAHLAALMSTQAEAGGDDPVAALTTAAGAVQAAFAEPGALDREVHHLIGDISGAELLGIRLSENVVHGWDLAAALGVDLAIDDDIVDQVYARLAPQAAALAAATGFFTAPSRSLPVNASRLEQVLHLVGR